MFLRSPTDADSASCTTALRPMWPFMRPWRGGLTQRPHGLFPLSRFERNSLCNMPPKGWQWTNIQAEATHCQPSRGSRIERIISDDVEGASGAAEGVPG